MPVEPRKHDAAGPNRIVIGFVVLILTALLGAVNGSADIMGESPPRVAATGLEGVRFAGPFGAEAETNPKQDTFTFKDGKFATASCLEWGFVPAPYWVRRDAQGIHFLAELKSPEHGTMRYEGMFDGKVLRVVGFWKKERWYWTTERTYRGHGRPVNRPK